MDDRNRGVEFPRKSLHWRLHEIALDLRQDRAIECRLSQLIQKRQMRKERTSRARENW